MKFCSSLLRRRNPPFCKVDLEACISQFGICCDAPYCLQPVVNVHLVHPASATSGRLAISLRRSGMQVGVQHLRHALLCGRAYGRTHLEQHKQAHDMRGPHLSACVFFSVGGMSPTNRRGESTGRSRPCSAQENTLNYNLCMSAPFPVSTK